MSDFLGIHGAALILREQRLQVISSNLANADTPGFQAQDMDFNSALQAALSPSAGAGGSDPYEAATAGARYARPSSQPSLDGNTVDAAREQTTFSQAALDYRASMTFIEDKVRTMLSAISGE